VDAESNVLIKAAINGSREGGRRRRVHRGQRIDHGVVDYPELGRVDRHAVGLSGQQELQVAPY